MFKSRLRKGLIAALSFLFVICLSIGVIFGVSAILTNSDIAGETISYPAYDEAGEGYKKFTFGKTYSIAGKQYTLGESEDENIDFYSALGYNKEEYSVNLTSFTYKDGTDGTDETTEIRNAGTYKFAVTALADDGDEVEVMILVDSGTLVIDVDSFPVFVNAQAVGYELHGNILTIFKGNSGWFMAKKDGDRFVESKVITNGYCYYSGAPRYIQFRGETLNGTYNTATSSTLTITAMQDGKKVEALLNITSREGVGKSDDGKGFTDSNEYIASFNFESPNRNYVFTYGDNLSDQYKWLDIIETGTYNFTVTKHWFVIHEKPMFSEGMISGNEPYSPFGSLTGKVGTLFEKDVKEGTVNVKDGIVDKAYAYDNSGVSYVDQLGYKFFDTMYYLDDITVRPPRAWIPVDMTSSNRDNIAGDIYYAIKYVDLDGVTHTIVSENDNKHFSNSANNTDKSAELSYYFNSSMPAGTYTLTLSCAPTSSARNESCYPVSADYVLYVLPKAIDGNEEAQTALEHIASAIKGIDPITKEDSGHAFRLADKEIYHAELLKKYAKELEDTLNGERKGYWAKTEADEYYDTSVTFEFNREGTSSSSYGTVAETINNLSAYTYTFYYSISAKNYVTLGGSAVDDDTRTSYKFEAKLYDDLPDVLNLLVQRKEGETDAFSPAKYIGTNVTTTVPSSTYYTASYGYNYKENQLRYNINGKDYINVGKGVAVILTINGSWADYYGWGKEEEYVEAGLKAYDPDNPEEDADFYIVDDLTIVVFFEIIKGDNEWALAPTIAPWTYDSFNASVNSVVSRLKFTSGDITAYYRIGVYGEPQFNTNGLTWIEEDGYWWLSVNGAYTVREGAEYADINKTYFKTASEVATYLNKLDYGSSAYVLDSYVVGDKNVNDFKPESDTYNTITVMQAINTWTSTPGMTGWGYKGVTETSFQIGEDKFSAEKDKAAYPSDDYESTLPDSTVIDDAYETGYDGTITYEVYKGNQRSAANARQELVNYITKLEYTLREDSNGDYVAYLSKGTLDILKDLQVGEYTLVATRLGNHNYVSIVSATIFNVSPTQDIWSSMPQMNESSWAFRQFKSSYIKDGAGNLGSTRYTISYSNKGDAVKSYDGNTTYDGTYTYSELTAFVNSLPQGSYTLTVTTAEDEYGNANFTSAIAQTLRFTVAKADFEWENGTEPSISGWTYKSEDPSTQYKGYTTANAQYTIINEEGEEQTLTFGEETFGKAIEYKFYKAQQNGDEWSRIGEALTGDVAEFSAGDYIMVVTVSVSEGNEFYGNYNDLVHSVHFNVAMTAGSWDKEPEGSFEWSWGDLEVYDGKTQSEKLTTLLASNFYNASPANLTAGEKYTVTYAVRCLEGEYSDNSVTVAVTVSDDLEHQRNNETLLNFLKQLPYGYFQVTVTVSQTTNYGSLSTIIYIRVNRGSFTFDEGHQPTNTGWDYHADEAVKTVVKPIIRNVKGNTVSLKYSYTYNGLVQTLSDPYSFDELQSILKNGKAGTYVITVVVDDSQADGKGLSFRLSNYLTSEFTYVITVTPSPNEWTVEPNNYYTFEYDNDLPGELDKSKGAKEFAAKYGVVSYYTKFEGGQYRDELSYTNGSDSTNNQRFDDFIRYIKTLPSGTHYVYILVSEVTGEFYGLDAVTVEIYVKGRQSHWGNEGKLELEEGGHSEEITYSDDMADDINAFILPLPQENDPIEHTLTYYVSYNGSPVTQASTASDIITWLTQRAANKSNSVAGTYVIRAVYVPQDGSYSTLEYTVTITVNRAEPKWGNKSGLSEDSSQDYGAISITAPQLAKTGSYYNSALESRIVVKVTNSLVNSGANLYTDTSVNLVTFLNKLNVVGGFYVIVWELAETDNYVGLTFTHTLAIGKAENKWEDVGGVSGDGWLTRSWSFARKGTISIVVPEATIGNENMTIWLDGAQLPANYRVSDDDVLNLTFTTREALQTALNRYLTIQNLSAGSHTLEFKIEGDGNYNGRTSICTITINKISTTWATDEATGKSVLENVLSGSTVPANFYIPTPSLEEYAGLLRFDIARSDGSYVGRELTKAEFETALKTLANGNFTVTAYVGGDYEKLTGNTDLNLLNAFNADYEVLTCSCRIELSATANSWEDANVLAALARGWEWYGFDSVKSLLKMPKAEYGNDLIIYTINGADAQTFSAADYESDAYGLNYVKAYNALLAYLATANAGTYSLTVSIEVTGAYSAPTSIVVASFTIAKATPTWNNTAANANGKSFEWTYQASGNPSLPEPTINYISKKEGDTWGNNNSITYQLTRPDGSTQSSWTGWTGMVNSLNTANYTPGTYTLTARIEGDDNHEELLYTIYVVIGIGQNSWETKTGNGTETAVAVEWTYHDLKNPAVEFVPAHGTVTYTVNGAGVTGDLATYLYNLSASTTPYIIVARVAADSVWSALVDTVSLTIKQVQDTWYNDEEFGIQNVFGIGTEQTGGTYGWTWDNVAARITTNLIIPVPVYGTSATVVVSMAAGATSFMTTLYYVTEGGRKQVLADNLNALITRLCGLDVANGGYTISITINEPDSNYAAPTSVIIDNASSAEFEKAFTILQATNTWDAKPKVGAWSFNGDMAFPSATPHFGSSVTFTYANISELDTFETVDGVRTRTTPYDAENEEKWSDTHDYAEGTYWLRAVVEGTSNYTRLVGYYAFTIGAGVNDWVIMPGVIAWNWDNYDPTINLFRGSAKNNGTATFTVAIYGGSNEITRDTLKTFVKECQTDEDFNRYFQGNIDKSAVGKLNGIAREETTPGSNIRVVKDKDVIALLNALKPGITYVLFVEIAGGENYQELTGWTTFTVGMTSNSWDTDEDGKIMQPSVSNFIYGESAGTFTAGKAKYGTVKYQITGGDGYTSAVLSAYQVAGVLAGLNASSSNYNLCAWVDAADDDPYYSFYSEASPYTSQFRISVASNRWTTDLDGTLVSWYWAVLHADTFTSVQFEAQFGKPAALVGTENAVYTLLDADYKAINGDTTYSYGELFDAIKELAPGEYYVRITIAASTNYTAISATVSLKINRYTSEFTNINSSKTLEGKWEKDGTKLTSSAVSAQYTNENGGKVSLNAYVMYSLQNSSVSYNYADFLTEVVASLSAGSYQIVVTVDPTFSYTGITDTLQLTIALGDNRWLDTPSASIVDAKTQKSTNTWEWKTPVEWLGVTPLNGTTVEVSIVSSSNTAEVLKYFNVSTTDGSGSQIEAVSTYLSNLDYGSYIMYLRVQQGNNWNGIDITEVRFSVTTAKNYWDEYPSFSVSRGSDGKYSWTYGTAVTESAKPHYPENGAYSVVYYDVQNKQYTQMPTDVGEYRAVFSALKDPENLNFEDLISDTYYIVIEGAENKTVSQFGVSGWVWDNYDRETNLFRGTPATGGAVTFEILMGDETYITEFALVGDYVPEELVPELNKLEAAIYTLRIHVAANGNYVAFTADFEFTISESANEWVTVPQVVNWSRGGWFDYENMPKAKAVYGDTYFEIASDVSGAVLFQGYYRNPGDAKEVSFDKDNRAELENYEIVLNKLNDADAGWYTMTVRVEAYVNRYRGHETSVGFQIFVKGSNDKGNSWEVDPHMESWVAEYNEEKGEFVYNLPTGQPVRGKAYFVFFAVENLVEVYEVVEGVDSHTIKASDGYARDFYIPLKPGTYHMYAYAYAENSDGSIYDELESDTYAEFTIYDRVINWEQTVEIDSLLQLGDRYDEATGAVIGTWGKTEAKADLFDSEIVYTYINRETGEVVGKFKVEYTTGLVYDISGDEPIVINHVDANARAIYCTITKPGKYLVRAEISARYTSIKTTESEFEIKLSQNEWLKGTSPSIESWSEEFNSTSPNPVGGVAHGTIVYTYINKAKPDEILTEKPTEAGNYILIARVELEGYETLEATYDFTIEPAYDITLVIICIALATLASLMLCVVIYFAIRRNRET